MSFWVSAPWESDSLLKSLAHQDFQGCQRFWDFQKRSLKLQSNVWLLRAVFRGIGCTFLNITDNTVTVPQYDEDPVPSTSKQPLMVALVSSSHCVRPLLCALSEQVLSLERNSVDPRHFRTASLLSRNHFTIVTSYLPQEFLLTLSVVGISVKSEVKGRDFYIWRHHRCFQIFQRETNMPPPVPKQLVDLWSGPLPVPHIRG